MVCSLCKRSSAWALVWMHPWSRWTTNGSTRIWPMIQWLSWCRSGRMARSPRLALRTAALTRVASATKVALACMGSPTDQSRETLLQKRHPMMRRKQLQPPPRNERIFNAFQQLAAAFYTNFVFKIEALYCHFLLIRLRLNQTIHFCRNHFQFSRVIKLLKIIMHQTWQDYSAHYQYRWSGCLNWSIMRWTRSSNLFGTSNVAN